METNRIRQFCTVVETENLRKSAEILNMSHSALSKSLKVLQFEIQKELLAQSGRNIVVTEEGKDFYKKALIFLNDEKKLLEPNNKTSNIMRIGTFEVFSTHLLGTHWNKYFKNTELNLYELLPGKLEQALNNNDIDFAITYEPIAMKNIEYVKIGTFEMGLYGKQDSFKGTSFENLPFVAPINPIEGTPTGTKGLDGWPEDRHSRKILYHVDMMESGLTLVRQGLAVIFIPHFVANSANYYLKDEYKFKNIPIPKKMKSVKRDIYIMKRNNQSETNEMRILAKLIRSECLNK